MLHDLMRQRRRIAFAVLFSQLASLWIWPGVPMIGIMAICVLVVSVLIVVAAKSLRQSVECGAVGFYAAAMMPPILMVPMFLAVSALTFGIFYTHFLDRFPVRIGLRSRKRFHAPFDLQTTWAKIVPGQGHVAAHWTGTMISAQEDEDDENTLYLMFNDADNAIEEVTLTYLTLNPHFTASYLLERDSKIAGEEIIMSYKFAKAGLEKTTIISDMRVSGLPIRLAMMRYFDDVLGDELDSFATMVDCHRAWSFRNAKKVNLTDEMGSTEDIALGVIPTGQWPEHGTDIEEDEIADREAEATDDKAAA
jgi:hypothetical protein